MTSNTQENARYGTNTTSTGSIGLRDNDPSLSSQNPSYHDTTGQGDILGTSTTEHRGIGTGTGADTGRASYGSSPLNPTTQQQYGQGTTPGQYDSPRIGEGGTESDVAGSGQQQYGRGQGSGNVGVGGSDTNTTTMTGTSPLSLRPEETATEQTTKGHHGRAGDDPSATTGATTLGTGTQAGYPGGTTGVATTGSGTGTDNQYLGDTAGHHGRATTGHHGLGFLHQSGADSHGETGTGAKPSVTDKIVGGVEKVAGKVTSNTGMYQRGEERATGEHKSASKRN